MPRKPEFVAAPVVVSEPPGDKLCDHGVRFAERCAECEAVLGSPMPGSWAAKAPMGKPRIDPSNSIARHNGEVPKNADFKLVIDALPNVPYAEGTFAPGTHEMPNRIVEVPTVTGPSMEALGERRAQLRANLGHARNSVKGADDSRAVAAENSLRKFDESGDGIRLRLFAISALKETSHAQA